MFAEKRRQFHNFIQANNAFAWFFHARFTSSIYIFWETVCRKRNGLIYCRYIVDIAECDGFVEVNWAAYRVKKTLYTV